MIPCIFNDISGYFNGKGLHCTWTILKMSVDHYSSQIRNIKYLSNPVLHCGRTTTVPSFMSADQFHVSITEVVDCNRISCWKIPPNLKLNPQPLIHILVHHASV